MVDRKKRFQKRHRIDELSMREQEAGEDGLYLGQKTDRRTAQDGHSLSTVWGPVWSVFRSFLCWMMFNQVGFFRFLEPGLCCAYRYGGVCQWRGGRISVFTPPGRILAPVLVFLISEHGSAGDLPEPVDVTAEHCTGQRGKSEIQLKEAVEVAHGRIVLKPSGDARLAVGRGSTTLTLLLSKAQLDGLAHVRIDVELADLYGRRWTSARVQTGGGILGGL
mmetsp:Transcript_13047/g.39436  ORF Transcript_13047/g.39436 Transcript_13047/m.39436 type:complete len:220 (+) Transcript_13047:4366-5025(+)